ncbi:MAG: 2-dehydropantoate 2-reductase [Desulfobulbaceae bacterium]|nr:2-dehydropantoate 2-reductase [Desulfobulbaceae bacterium]
MRIVIVGPGALGSLLTARLFLFQQETAGTGNDILSLHLLDYRPERSENLQKNGLLFEEEGHKILCTPQVTLDPEVCVSSDVLFFCVKSIAVTSALGRLKPYLSRRSLLLAMQNGIGHLEEIQHAAFPAGVGITSEGATLMHPGHVRHGGRGITRLGLLTGHTDRSERVLQKTTALLDSAGMRAEVTRNPLKHIWAKLFVNVGINALTALHGCRNGELLRVPSTVAIMEKAVKEAELVARARGIPVDADPVQATITVCRTTANNTSSMLQDVLQKRMTEIDAINGAVVAEGVKLGIATPVNTEIVRRIKELEASYV